jgi:hypothetical protein
LQHTVPSTQLTPTYPLRHPALPGEGALRLVDGPKASAGRLQMFWDGSWNNVCSSNVLNDTATKVCQLLGFPNTKGRRVNSSTYDERSLRNNEPHVWVPYVSCAGGETSFKRCFSDNAPYKLNDGGSKCYSSASDAAVVCEPVAGAKKNAAHVGMSAAGRALYLVVVLAVLQALVG